MEGRLPAGEKLFFESNNLNYQSQNLHLIKPNTTRKVLIMLKKEIQNLECMPNVATGKTIRLDFLTTAILSHVEFEQWFLLKFVISFSFLN